MLCWTSGTRFLARTPQFLQRRELLTLWAVRSSRVTASDAWQFAGVVLPWIGALRRPGRAFAGGLCAADAKALADQDGCAGPQIGPLNSAPVAGGCSHLPAGMIVRAMLIKVHRCCLSNVIRL